MSGIASKLVTAEELYAMGDIGRCELVRGEIIHIPPAGADHGDIAAELARLIGNFVKERHLGKIYARTGRLDEAVAAYQTVIKLEPNRAQGYHNLGAVLAMFHDQGLCVAKALDFRHTVNVTLGLPLPRTSPDHGVAYDIAGKNLADPEPMIQALLMAVKLAGMKRH